MKKLDTIENPDEIKIHVVGSTGTGKTTIQIIIADALRANGFNVEVLTKPDFDSERRLRRYVDIYDEDRHNKIRNRVKKITINEVYARHTPYNYKPGKSSLVW